LSHVSDVLLFNLAVTTNEIPLKKENFASRKEGK